MSKDEADRLKEGSLPRDPTADARRVASDAPRILTVKQIMDLSAKRAMSAKARNYCTTGSVQLDDATGGMRPGHVWVFGADTNWGKSSWLTMVADVNIKRNKRVLIVSAEDDESLYGDRFMVRRSRVNAKRYRNAELEPFEEEAVREVMKHAEPIPVYLDARGRKAEWVAKQVKQAIAEHQIDLVAYDYLQEFRSGRQQQDRRNEVSSVASMLREPIKTSGITGIIFSQITITAEKKYPDKHSIRESRDVSNAAEVILLGYSPGEDIVEKDDNGQAKRVVKKGSKCVLIDKCKDGPKGFTIPLVWDEHTASFVQDIDMQQQGMTFGAKRQSEPRYA